MTPGRAVLFAIALAGLSLQPETASADPPAASVVTFDGQPYSSYREALQAVGRKKAEETARIPPLPQKAGGTLLVALPNHGDSLAYVDKISPPGLTGEGREFIAAVFDAGIDQDGQALEKAGLFDSVVIRHDGADPSFSGFDYRLRFTRGEPPGTGKWVLERSGGGSLPVVIPAGKRSPLALLTAWTIAVNNATADLGAPLARLPFPPADGGAADGVVLSPPRLQSGTAFFVNAHGYALTAAHVVEGCKSLKLALPDGVQANATVVSADQTNDLAVLKVTPPPPQFARFSASSLLRQGEEVVTYGYPLAGTLSTHGNLSTGVISAVTGLHDDTRILQITAPIQQGNSGGPVLDDSGAVIALVSSKLNALKTATASGDLPQNVNFAIKASIALNFLDTNDIAYERQTQKNPLPVADIGDRAKGFTFMALCQK